MKNVYPPYVQVINELCATHPGFSSLTEQQWADITTAHLYFTRPHDMKTDISLTTLLPFATLYLRHTPKVKFLVFAKAENSRESIALADLEEILKELSLEQLVKLAFAYKYRVGIDETHKYHHHFLKLFPVA